MVVVVMVVVFASRVHGEGAECEQTPPDYTQMFVTVILDVLDKCITADTLTKQHRLWKQCGNEYTPAVFNVSSLSLDVIKFFRSVCRNT